ncbi:hypothetical protein PENSPDRAFT_653575 [Peniophora sp. CONT]|nr:hypothetical protein PENSPDRAFT_653575 [Peniophora sp. CONT]
MTNSSLSLCISELVSGRVGGGNAATSRNPGESGDSGLDSRAMAEGVGVRGGEGAGEGVGSSPGVFADGVSRG